MINNKTVIISCAGMGKRLGIGCPKALVDIDGEPLIIRTLKLLKNVEDVRVVVGYQAEKVIKVVNNFRKDITFVFNHKYMSNGTGASVSLGAINSKKLIMTIDGDLLVRPEDMEMLIGLNDEFIGVTDAGTDNPVLAKIDGHNVVKFSREEGEYEWTGVCQIRRDRFISGEKHLYFMLEPLLPLKAQYIHTKEIDTPHDYELALEWVRNGYKQPTVIGVLGCMGSYATLGIFRKILEAFPCEKEWARPRILIDNYCTMPSRVRAVLYGENKEQLIDLMDNALGNLIKCGANRILIGCNTAHILYSEILKRKPMYDNYVVNIIVATADWLKEHKLQKVYVLGSEGTIESKIYQTILSKYKIEAETPSPEGYRTLREFIEAIKINHITQEVMNKFVRYISNISNDVVVLGCTELPVLYDLCKDNPAIKNKVIIDPINCGIEEIKGKM